MKTTLFALSLCSSLLISSCASDDEISSSQTSTTQIDQIPQGQTGTVSNADLSGQGTQTNIANTTVAIDGKVTVDAMSVNGTLEVPVGNELIVNGDLVIGGGADLKIEGVLRANNLTLIGNVEATNADIYVSNKLTIGGGVILTTTQSYFEIKELVITGHIKGQAVQNVAYPYSLFYFTAQSNFNRGGGTIVCGPIVFSSNNNLGADQTVLNEITGETKAAINTLHYFNSDINYYQFEGAETCQ